MERILSMVQKIVVVTLAALMAIVVLLSTAHLAVLIGEEVWTQPRFLIPVDGLLDVFGFFLLVLIGVELLETLKAYFKKDELHLRVVLEVALIAVARKVIIQEPDTVSSLTLLAIAALILVLGVVLYLERQSHPKPAILP